MIEMALALFLAAAGQAGDRKGEEQPPLPSSIKIPPAPILSPAEALRTFKIQPGFRLELVASEPLVQDPVAIAFDADLRLWVAEMLGYMPDVDGTGEDAPVGRIVVLEDSQGTGVYDKSTVFLDRLVLPRALCLVYDGILVAEPPGLYFCRSTRGDLKCNEKTLVVPNYASVRVVEHTANGLLRGMDNWIYSANSTLRLRRVDGKWIQGSTRSRGQWGLTMDDHGRLFHNNNSDLLRGDLLPVYLPEAHAPKSKGVNVQLLKDQSTWPIRVNPGVNRGYQKGQLREDGTLRTCTAACGPGIYRGDNFPPEFRGNAFLCEPAGNLLKRAILSEENGTLVARNAYNQAEFLASTDERFRPVNVTTAPDGSLYIVDMYRGIIQHRLYVTSFLRKQILSRGLDKGLGLGRIYRVSSTARPLAKPPKLSSRPSAELVQELSHPNGWVRDTAQRLLVDRGEVAVAPALRKLATSAGDAVPRLHALFTLDGLKQLDAGTLDACIADRNPEISQAAKALKDSPGLLGPVDALALAATSDPRLPDAKLEGKELDLLVRLMAAEEWESSQDGRSELLARISSRVVAAGHAEAVSELLDLTASQATAARWRQRALLEGMAQSAREISLGKPSPALLKLVFAEDPKVAALAAGFGERVLWPGKPAKFTPPPLAPPLTPEEKSRWDRGRRQYGASCVACHQRSGLGEESKGPPLVDSEWVLGSEERLVRIVAHGLHGPITINGKGYQFQQEMPAILNASSEELSEILTYIRHEWGHQAAPVKKETVSRVRSATDDREEPWTQKELEKIP